MSRQTSPFSVTAQLTFAWLCIQQAATEGVERRVDGFIHLTDLHLSTFVPERAIDLQTLFQNELATFNFSTVLVTGDLVSGKTIIGRSDQSLDEWEQYNNVTAASHRHLGTTNSTFIDIRGNHDMFDAGLRNTDRDFYRTHGAQGSSWEKGRVHIYPPFSENICPVYCLVGIDGSPEIGLRSPTNFFGVVWASTVEELELQLIENMRQWFMQDCYPTYLAYSHYPLSTMSDDAAFDRRITRALSLMLIRYGVATWLCGHLHDAFGGTLSRFHDGYASTLLELELIDWKIRRAVRIVTIDEGHLSFLDLAHVPGGHGTNSTLVSLDGSASMQGAFVLITYPPSLHFSPLGNRSGKMVSNLETIRAYVFPMSEAQLEESMDDVSVLLFCGGRLNHHRAISMRRLGESFLYETTEPVHWDSKCDKKEIQVMATVPSATHLAYSERRWIASNSKAVQAKQGFKQWLALAYPWTVVFQYVFILLMISHILCLLILPKIPTVSKLLKVGSQEDALKQAQKQRIPEWLLAVFRGWIQATECRMFWRGQLFYAVYLLLGPWYFARVLSDRPIGIMFVYRLYLISKKGHWFQSFSAVLPFRACLVYVQVILPQYLWLAWTVNRRQGAGVSGKGKQTKLVMSVYCCMGLVAVLGMLHTAIVMWKFYGALSVFMSPLLIGWLALTATTFFSSHLQTSSKSRSE